MANLYLASLVSICFIALDHGCFAKYIIKRADLIDEKRLVSCPPESQCIENMMQCQSKFPLMSTYEVEKVFEMLECLIENIHSDDPREENRRKRNRLLRDASDKQDDYWGYGGPVVKKSAENIVTECIKSSLKPCIPCMTKEGGSKNFDACIPGLSDY